MSEHRDRQRLDLAKLAFAKDGDNARGGLLKNISSTGASLEFVYPMGRGEHTFVTGEAVDIDIDGFDTLKGKIIRTEETGIAVHFDLEAEREDTLIAEIMRVANEIPEEEVT